MAFVADCDPLHDHARKHKQSLEWLLDCSHSETCITKPSVASATKTCRDYRLLA